MPPRPENAPPAAWQTLAQSLRGSLTARARGVLTPRITLLDGTGQPFGDLEPHGAEGATLTAGDAEANIEPTDGSNHQMISGGVQLLNSQPRGSATALGIQTAGQTYEAGLSLLRNRATARTPDDLTAARISGGLSNRRYDVAFDPDDPNALPIALFLLYRLNALRSRAYRTRP